MSGSAMSKFSYVILDYVPEVMGTIIFKRLEQACYTATDPLPPLPPIQSLIQTACDKQATIGWDQLLCGRLALTWGTIIADQLYANRISEKDMTALTWGRRFSCMVFDLVLKLWTQRNTDGHLSTRQQDLQLTGDRLMAKIHALQESNPNISYQERAFVHRSIELLEAYSLTNLQAWHKMALNVVQASKQRQPKRHKRRRNPRGKKGASDPNYPIPIPPDM